MKFISILLLLVLHFGCKKSPPQISVITSLGAETIYAEVSKEKYLIGDYARDKALVKITNKKENDVFYLRKEVAEAFSNMVEAYDKDRAGKSKQHLFIKSAFRSYSDQKSIWEEKYKGNRKMRESVAGKTPEEIVALILEFSSAPGTSRHHWGTDMDLNALENNYFEKGGNGEFLYQWMKLNAKKFGFCQPYNELSKRNGKGYFEEKWHWSYAPISNLLMQDWVEQYKSGKIQYKGKFLGSEVLGDMPLTYVTSINPECLDIN